MLLNISTDRITFMNGEDRIVLPYGDLEKSVSDFLYSPAFAAVKSQLVVINWPWSFTNLRIVTLALNTYNMLHEFPIDFVSISKIDRYKAEFEAQKSGVKRYCLMYIGQKKNFWIVDLSIKSGEWVIKNKKDSSATPLNDAIVKVHVDQLKDHVATLWDEWFVDEMVAEGKEMIDEVLGENLYDMYAFEDELRETRDDQKITKLLEPNYMIEANVN